MLKVSFYSYKGGSGRSTTAWNTIQRLVELMKPTAKEPFVIVDTDTESAGSTFLYKAKDCFWKDSKYKSIQKRMTGDDADYSRNAFDEEKKAFFEGMCPIGNHFGSTIEKGAVLLIGANLDKKSVAGADISGKHGERSEQVENFQNITTTCRNYGVKALFFDTPSGTQFLARLSVRESDIVVCCMRPTSQFREGTRGQLIDFIEYDVEKRVERKYILTPTTVCVDKEQLFTTINRQEHVYPNRAKADIEDEFSIDTMQERSDYVKAGFKVNVLMDMLKPTPDELKEYNEVDDNELVFGIPEVRRFKWFEECLGRLQPDTLLDNDKIAVNRYEYLARTILKHQKKKQIERG